MHAKVYRKFEEILSRFKIRGPVLEIGAVPNPKSLLASRLLSSVQEKVGLNLDGPHQFAGFQILRGNANEMIQFKDGEFELVLCNAVLEHDPHFWKSVQEIKRVTKPGGFIMIGVPGYVRYPLDNVQSGLHHIPIVRSLVKHPFLNALFNATLTYRVHEAPGDYYRFSENAVREVLLKGLGEVEIHRIMLPPRLIGAGRKAV